MTTTPTRPVELAANQPPQFYRGGSSIAALRGANVNERFGPEDWVASTTTRFGTVDSGLSRLPDGKLLRAAIEADPVSWLGAAHVEQFGADPALLVKLLDAGQRLPVHCHPSDEFARAYFASHFGKTEAWIVIGTDGQDPTVYAGFRKDVDASTAADWVATQDSEAMLSALNPIPVTVGDTVLIPAGLPHAIGSGVFVAELQQPTDFSITLEWQGFLETAEHGHLGIGFPAALGALDRSGWSPERLESLVTRRPTGDRQTRTLLPPGAAPFFRAEALAPSSNIPLTEEFSVLVGLSGEGVLYTPDGVKFAVSQGSTLVIPHAAGECTLSGSLTALRALPPDPAVARDHRANETHDG